METRSKDEHIESLINEIAGLNWVCPKTKWNDVYKKLPEVKQKGAGYEPPIPLTLSAWWHTTDAQKKERFIAHMNWAMKKKSLDNILTYLKKFDENEWLRMGEGPDPKKQELSIDEELFFAVEYDDADEVNKYLNYGANINAKNDIGQSIGEVCIEEGNFELLKLLLERNLELSYDLLTSLVAKDELEVAQILLDRGLDINGFDRNGWSPLSMAAYLSSINTLKWVIERNAKINQIDQNENGMAALHHVACNGDFKKFNVLLSAGGNINLLTKNGKSVKDFAIEYDNQHLLNVSQTI